MTKEDLDQIENEVKNKGWSIMAGTKKQRLELIALARHGLARVSLANKLAVENIQLREELFLKNVIPIKKSVWQRIKDFIKNEPKLAKEYRKKYIKDTDARDI